jgi:hypothetical protein
MRGVACWRAARRLPLQRARQWRPRLLPARPQPLAVRLPSERGCCCCRCHDLQRHRAAAGAAAAGASRLLGAAAAAAPAVVPLLQSLLRAW